MKAKELMDKDFVYLSCEDSVVEVSKVMEEIRRFTCPVVNDNKQLVGWITSFDITRGLREGNEKINEVRLYNGAGYLASPFEINLEKSK